MSCDLSEINATIVNSNDIESTESIDEIFASELVKCNVSITSLQTSLLEIIIVDEFSLVLKQMTCNLSEINANIVNINDIESKTNEILASEFRK